MHELTLQYRSLDKLQPCPTNARMHSARQVEQIAKSIEATAFANPILIDEAGVIIAGHGRLLAAKKLKLTEAPVIILPGLTEAQKRLLRIADNKIALNSSWDVDLLKVELQEITISGLDVEVTGFEIGEVDVFLAEQTDPAEDLVPPTVEVAVTQPGDIWLLGKHRLGCGDVRQSNDLDTLMAGAKADAAFLDPPYNVPIDGYATGRGQFRHREFEVGCGEMSKAEFSAFLSDTLGPCAAVSRKGAVHFICMDHHHAGELIAAADEAYELRLNICVWSKNNAGLGKLYRSQHELIFVCRVGETQHRNNVQLGKHGRYRTNVWEYPSVNGFSGTRKHDLSLHPTVKPVAMVADAIQDVTKPGDIVLDTFMGSGTTLIAAERTGRICYGLEIDPHYVEVALDRWAALTGRDPVLETTGETLGQRRERRKASA
jgi:DNA modification methylase